MKAYDYEAVTYDGAVYCTECLPDGISVESEDVSPIFANSEWDSAPCCDKCHCRHDYMTITHASVEKPIRALCQFLNCQPDDVTEERYDCYGMTIYSAEGGEYAVGTDAEADAAWDASLDSYIEECITPELDKLEIGNLSAYVKFDEEMWKRDARMDGRGHSLSSYDGDENEETVGGETYYIFRIN